MRLLRDEPVEFCYALGQRLGTIHGLLRVPGDWRQETSLLSAVSVQGGNVTDTLAPHVLSEPAARKVDLVQRMVPGMRGLVFDLAGDLLHLDLRGAPPQGRWLAAGFLLGQLPTTKSSTDRTAVLRLAAQELAPASADATFEALRRLKQRDTSAWLIAIGEAARLGTIRAEATPPKGAPTTSQCAWQPRRLFISHSSKDKALVRCLDSRLRDRATLDVILDERDLRPGTTLAPTIAQHIASCDWLIVCMSQHALLSSWVEQEIEHAQRHGVRIMPLRLDDAPLSPQLVDNLHADFTTAFDVAAERLVAALTDNPVYPFLGGDASAALEVTSTLEQDNGPRGNSKLARLTLRLRALAPTRVTSLLLTTIAHWTIERPDVLANAELLTPPAGAVQLRRAPGSKVVVRIDRTLAAGEAHEVHRVLYTEHSEDPGMGVYPFLFGAELLLHDGDPVRLGVALADLYGGEIVGYTRGAGPMRISQVSARQQAQEILRILPTTCLADPALLAQLRTLAGG